MINYGHTNNITNPIVINIFGTLSWSISILPTSWYLGFCLQLLIWWLKVDVPYLCDPIMYSLLQFLHLVISLSLVVVFLILIKWFQTFEVMRLFLTWVSSCECYVISVSFVISTGGKLCHWEQLIMYQRNQPKINGRQGGRNTEACERISEIARCRERRLESSTLTQRAEENEGLRVKGWAIVWVIRLLFIYMIMWNNCLRWEIGWNYIRRLSTDQGSKFDIFFNKMWWYYCNFV